MKNYHVLFIANESALGGAGTSLIDMIKGLQRKGNKCVVIIPAQGIIEERLKELDVTYYVVSYTVGYGRISEARQEDEDRNFYDNYEAAKRLQDLIQKEKIDLIHINSSVSNVGAFAAMMAGIPYVWHFRELLEEDFDCEFWDKPLKMELFQKCDALISISKTVQQSYKKKYGLDSDHVYNGVDAERYKRSITWEKQKLHKFLITGVISANKGQWDAVKAMDVLVKRGITNVHLSLLGRSSGRIVWIMRQFIREKHLENYVEIVPFQKDLSKYRGGNVYSITTSKMEALGRCTIEAMLAGNVVIGADTGGTLEIIGEDHTRGYLYKQGDYVSLADTMYQAMTDSVEAKKEYLENAQRYAEETFSLERYANHIIEIYDRVMQQNDHEEKITARRVFLNSLEKRFRELDYSTIEIPQKTFSEIQQLWNDLQENEIYIKEYFIERGLHNIAIYGMGNLGCHLYDEIIGADTLHLQYMIDRNDAVIGDYIKITSPEERLENIDILVVAMSSGAEKIINHYQGNGYKVVSIAEILETLQDN